LVIGGFFLRRKTSNTYHSEPNIYALSPDPVNPGHIIDSKYTNNILAAQNEVLLILLTRQHHGEV
jgi:hypothetical protein